MSFDQIPLSRPPAPPERRASAASATARWVIVVAGAVIALVALALWWMGRAQPPPALPAPTSATDPAQGSRRPSREPMELPTLAASDDMLRDLVRTLSGHPLLARLLATRGLVKTVVLSIVQIGDGRTPAEPLAILRPPTHVDITGGASGRIDPASYARWATAIQALRSVPASDAAQVYVNVKPLFDEAYRDLGYPDGDFDAALIRAIRTLDATPIVAGDPVLLRREGYFEHEDPTLRSLLPVQKQLLLFGPESRSQLMSWLHQLAATLELRLR